MRAGILSVVLLCTIFSAGCSFAPVRSNTLLENRGLQMLDPETGPVRIIQTSTDAGRFVDVEFRQASIEMEKPCRMRYSYHFDLFRNVSVYATFPNGKKYRAKRDTGFPWYAAVTDTVVEENSLAIFPGNNSYFPAQVGLCHLKSMKLGQINMINPPCTYFDQHWELQMAGLPIWKEKSVLIGLRLMEIFPYVMFDNPRREVEFGARGDNFTPDRPDQWQRYPFVIEDDAEGQRRLMVDLPVAGKTMHLLFDTGSPGGLQVSPAVWESIKPQVKHTPLKKSEILYWQFGAVTCEKTNVSKLTIANRTQRNSEVIIMPSDNPFKTDYSLVGIGFFDHDVLVFDFKQNVLWIKNH